MFCLCFPHLSKQWYCLVLLQSSGFAFESYETYFQAAIKFLHGASLLETYSNDSGKNGIMTQIQAYCTAAKLCE